MRTTYICFNLKSISCAVDNNTTYEKDYNAIYKPLSKFLFSHPDFPFSFDLNGSQLNYFRNRKNELLLLLKKLIEKKQIEIIGGGYYNPILPLIYPADRTGQIELFQTEVRHSLGKRPRGLTLYDDIWDPSIITSFHVGVIDYILMESSLIPENKQIFVPLVMTVFQKSVDIFPYYKDLNPTVEMSPEEFISNITKKIEIVEKKTPKFQNPSERIVNINLDHAEMYKLLENNWFEKFYDYVKTLDNIKLTTPHYFRKEVNNKLKCSCYIPAGINDNVSKYIPSPFNITATKKNDHYTIYDYMETYNLSHALYCRMIYISMLVNQYTTDKQRKISARAELWKAQNGNSLVWSDEDLLSNVSIRQNAYKQLMKVEQILREEGKFKETVTKFDYSNDGLEDYVCRMDGYFAYISLLGGCVQELDLCKQNTGNYLDNLSRMKQFDGYNDDYKRGLFIDHIFTNKQFSSYVQNEENSEGIFSQVMYTEVKFDRSKREIHLSAHAILDNNVPILLKKSYRIDSNGMFVRYIIRNEGEKKIKSKFAVESNFACLNYKKSDVNYYKLDVVANNDIYYINDDKKLVSGDKNNINNKLESSEVETTDYDNLVNDVTSLRITDIENEIAFSYEPNEKSGFCFNTIEFKRPNKLNELVKVQKTFVGTLFWDLEIEPGLETEKNLTFTISNVKKLKK